MNGIAKSWALNLASKKILQYSGTSGVGETIYVNKNLGTSDISYKFFTFLCFVYMVREEITNYDFASPGSSTGILYANIVYTHIIDTLV